MIWRLHNRRVSGRSYPRVIRGGHISLFGYLLFNCIGFFVLNQLSLTSYIDPYGV